MKCDGFGIKILSHALHLACKMCIIWSSMNITRSDKRNWIVSFLKNKHSDDFFVSVHNKISSKFGTIFICVNQFLRVQIG